MLALATVSPASDVTTDLPVPRSRIVVAKLGNFHDPRYGDFAITADMAAKWQANLSGPFGGRIAIDLDHAPERGRGSEAAGWITGLSVEGKYVYGDVEWTPLGESAIKERRYLYVSPTFAADYKDEHGNGHGEALIGLALTNRPVLRQDMPTLNLSRDDLGFARELADFTQDQRDELAKTGAAMPDGSFPIRDRSDLANAIHAVGRATNPAAAKAHIIRRAKAIGASDMLPDSWAGADSPKAMDTVTLIKALGLAEDADEAKILEAVQAKSDTRTLDERAEAEGKVLLSKADHDKLTAAEAQVTTLAGEVKEMQDERADEKFQAAYHTALTEGRVDAKEETKSLHRALYDAKPDDAIRLLASLPKVVNLTARGTNGPDTGAAAAPVDGSPVDEDRHKLLERAKALQAEQTGLSLLAAVQAAENELAGVS